MAGEPDLSPGQSSEWVLYLQRLLNHHYQQSVVPENGEFDETTENAVRHFREQNGLGEGSDVDSETWARLSDQSTSSSSSSSEPSSSSSGGGADGGTGEHGNGPGTEPSEAEQGRGNDQDATANGNWPEAHSVKVWLKVFIPGSYHGNIDGVGAAAGHRLLKGPSEWFNDCFHTDDRDFSNDITASCRMHSEFRLDLATNDLGEVHYCDETVEYDCEDGEEECRDTGSTSQMNWSNLRHEHGNILVDLTGSSNNPCFTGSPDIDYYGTVTIDTSAHTVAFEGAVNGFPAYEAYATINDGAGETLFQYGPRGEPTDLLGDAADGVSGTVSF